MPTDEAAPKPPQRAPWAVFDAPWYAARHPEVRDAVGADPAALEAHYRGGGRARGYSPNRFFDEAFYLDRHRDVAEAVAAGTWASGFDHYLAAGYREERDPHWLFEGELYRRLGPDLTPGALAGGGFVNLYDHYLRAGDREGRQASLFLDPAHLLGAVPETLAERIRRDGAFHHLLGLPPGAADALPLSPYFDAMTYRGRYPEAAAAIDGGRWHCALHHYLGNAAPLQHDPLPLFSERHYLDANPDVARLVAAGGARNGYRHFLTSGVFELRSPCPSLDLPAYLAAHPEAVAALRCGRVRDAFRHLLGLFDPAPPAGQLPRQAVLVLGMHRSGTSLLAGRLAAAGLEMPGTPIGGDPGMQEGHFETAEIVALNEAMLRATGGGWQAARPSGVLASAWAAPRLRADARALLARLLAGRGDVVIKDPRLCLVLPCWLDALADLGVRARLVVLVRQPEDVARSLERRNGLPRPEGRRLWARYMLELAAALDRRGVQPEAVLRYEALDHGVTLLAAALGLPRLSATGWRAPPPGPAAGADPALERLATGLRDAATLRAAIPGLRALLDRGAPRGARRPRPA